MGQDDSSSGMPNVLLRARGICKSFGPNAILRNVHFDVRQGEVHALLGENGAGKTTLLRILSGRYQPTSGTIELIGRPFKHLTPAKAQSLGVEIVPQLVELVDDLSIADNIYLGRWPMRGIWIDQAKIRTQSSRVLSELGIDLDPDTIVRELSYVEKQMVEIARINQFGPRVIILDEPTAALSVREIRILFALVNKLRVRGIGFVFVTHFLHEVTRMSDRVTILRDGVVAATGPTREFTIQSMVHSMVGDVDHLYTRFDHPLGETLFSLKNVRTQSIDDLSVELRAGEIVGLAAPKGEGVSDLLRAACGVCGRLRRGVIEIRGRQVSIRDPAHALKCGIGYLSEDRKRWGLIHGRSVRENVTIATIRNFTYGAGILDRDHEKTAVLALARKFCIATPGLEADIGVLSGGNQQKALIARLFNAHLDVYIMDDPTFGVDVASKAKIHQLISEEAARGAGVILHSSDLDELVQMCDRVLLLKDGRAARRFDRGQLSVSQLEELLEE